MPDDDHNIARHLSAMAAAQPERPALKVPRGRTPGGDIDYLVLSFAELEAEVNAWCERLSAAGIRPGDRTLVMVRQGLPLIASAFATFRIGAVPVIIDPGMGLKNFLAAVAHSQPRALIGIPLAQILSRVARRAFRSVRVRVGASGSLTARLTTAVAAETSDQGPRIRDSAGNGDALNVRGPSSLVPGLAVRSTPATALAAILFTSGSTGAPKGVCYEHGMFDAQVRMIRETYDIRPGEVDLPLLPIFALFNPALGMTTVVPEIDPKRPAAVDPAKIIQAIRQEGVTNSFGSPTLWRKIGDHCVERGIRLETVRRVLCAGAPVPAALWRAAPAFLPNGSLHSPYGATEALPVATVSAAEIDPTSVRGACVGRVVSGMEVRIIAIEDRPLRELSETNPVPVGEVGEIIVRGPVVTKTYDARPEATAAAKIRDGDTLWHRLGDCGYFDAEGRLWFCGRKVERVEANFGTLHTEPCEQVFRGHPDVKRCALIGLGPIGEQRPALVVEAKLQDSAVGRRISRELAALAQQHPHTERINLFYYRPQFPVDVRHNAKIHRLTLARWAAREKGFEIELRR